jgi:hypothetical protein
MATVPANKNTFIAMKSEILFGDSHRTYDSVLLRKWLR